MGVYIKGMDMPRSCNECRFRNGAWCMAIGTEDWRNAYNSPPDGKRLQNCPLVEVKAPHGRLIDENAVMREFAQRDNFSKKTLMDFLMEAPTVLEAEGKDDVTQD